MLYDFFVQILIVLTTKQIDESVFKIYNECVVFFTVSSIFLKYFKNILSVGLLYQGDCSFRIFRRIDNAKLSGLKCE